MTGREYATSYLREDLCDSGLKAAGTATRHQVLHPAG